MPVAVAPAPRSHSFLANAIRGRSRAASEVGPPQSREPERAQLPKAASYTYFPHVKELDPEAPGAESRRSGDDDGEIRRSEERTSGSQSGGSSPSSEEAPEAPGLQMQTLRPPTLTRRSSRFLSFTSSKSRDSSAEPKPDPKQERKTERGRTDTVKQRESPGGSPVRSLTKLRSKSWVVSSQQPRESSSPPKDKKNKHSEKTAESNKRKTLTTTATIPEESEARDTVDEAIQHPPSLSKKNKRLSGLFTATASASNLPAVPKSFSTEQLPLYPQTHNPASPTHLVPPLPRNVSAEKLKGIKTEPRKKDELWTAFRTLDGDLRKFQSKSSSLKANVVRTALLPFLRQYTTHPSNHKLRPEDLDRRVNILNGWWTGLLELVAGRNNQSISGTDRPVILEGIAAIMERPEWRLYPSPFCPLVDRGETLSASTATIASSAASSNSDFLAESVYHNVRNIFTQNLQSQMSFVVEKMSLRNAAASLVTFCGKTCAYAFCFSPGIADVLVRLWSPSLDMMKRVMEESGVSKLDRLDNVSERVVASFPPMLHSLKLLSLHRLLRQLHKPALPPLAMANIDWYGPWTKRWSGAESDLFYVFVKHFHILVSDFLPAEPSNAERICVPGLIMVHAQVLVNLDATINRNATPQQPQSQIEDTTSTASSITFDDVLEPDASASTIAIPPANATRMMQENRLIMLIRDFLSERNAHLHIARRMFADSFARLLQAQARKISIYDNSACYTLCDFLEEAFIIMVRYEQHESDHHTVMDWPFWLQVFRAMAASHNTATEIKLYAFLYSSWCTLVMDEKRKLSLCNDFLLEPEFFESRFNHWCPMVRSYFMRLICWRVARYDGQETEAEVSIKKALSDRLRSVWSHYLWLQEEAERKQMVYPSTQACNPAPGRRFLIIRNDNPIVANSGPFLSFDGVVQNPHQRKPTPTSNVIPEPDVRPASAMSTDSQDFPDEDQSKGKWNILRSFMGGSKQTAKSKSPGPSGKDKENASKSSNANGAKASTESPPTNTPAVPATPAPGPAPISHRSYNFRFSLEWVDKRFGSYQHMRLQPPRLPAPAQNLLQSKNINLEPVLSTPPVGAAVTSSTYAGRALAEWTFVSHECQNFFDRRKNEGVPTNRQVETPTLNVEAFRRPG
ncbi:repeatdomain containing protein [Pyrenophora tritici-repentis]|nr:repeatdomain containing protein [Pyrenophora tritici-repentis]